MIERRTKVTVNLNACLLPLLIFTGVPALFLLALIIGQAVIYG